MQFTMPKAVIIKGEQLLHRIDATNEENHKQQKNMEKFRGKKKHYLTEKTECE